MNIAPDGVRHIALAYGYHGGYANLQVGKLPDGRLRFKLDETIKQAGFFVLSPEVLAEIASD